MLTTDQKLAARQLLAQRPLVIPGTRAIPNETARREWFDSVFAEMRIHAVNTPREIKEFCDLAGVPD